VVVKVDPGAFISVAGTLKTNGTVDAPVVITSRKDDSAGGDTFHDGNADAAAPLPGDWEAIYLEPGSDASVLQGLEVRYAGMTNPRNNDFRDAILIRNGSPVLRDVRVRDVAWSGVRVLNGRPTIERVDVQRAGNVPFHFTLAANPALTNLTASSNRTEGLWIDGGTLTEDRTWAVTSMAYHVTTNVRLGAGATLAISPGVVVKMGPGDWFAVNGTLLVNGTLEAPVVFTSRKDDSVGGDTEHNGSDGASAPGPGDWEAL
jgi:hypothetical protein